MSFDEKTDDAAVDEAAPDEEATTAPVFGRAPTRNFDTVTSTDTDADTEELAVEPDPGTEAEGDAIAPGVPDEPEVEPEAEADVDASGGSDVDELDDEWAAAKVGFVDEPRQAVERAAALVTDAVRVRCQVGEDASTEDLRLAFRRYREVYDLLRS
jgi:hypothetical protein